MPLGSERSTKGALAKGERRGARSSLGSPLLPLIVGSSVLGILATSNVSSGQPPPVLELHWDAPLQCPQSDAVQDRIRALVGSAEVRPELLRAEGRITQTGDKYHLVLIVRSGSAAGIRALESDSCDHLSGAAAVGLGLLVRRARTASAPLTSEALGAPPPPETGDGVPSRPEAQETNPASGENASARPTSQTDATKSPHTMFARPQPPTPGPHAAKPARQLGVLLRVPSVEVGLVTLPGVSAGYSIAAGARYMAYEGYFSGVYFPRRSVENHSPAPGVDVTRYAVDFDGCRLWRYGTLEWGPCLHTGVMNVVARGTGMGLVSMQSSTLVWSAGAKLDTRLHLAEWFAFFLAARGELQTPRPRLVNQEIGELYRFPLIGLRFSFGSEWLF